MFDFFVNLVIFFYSLKIVLLNKVIFWLELVFFFFVNFFFSMIRRERERKEERKKIYFKKKKGFVAEHFKVERVNDEITAIKAKIEAISQRIQEWNDTIALQVRVKIFFSLFFVHFFLSTSVRYAFFTHNTWENRCCVYVCLSETAYAKGSWDLKNCDVLQRESTRCMCVTEGDRRSAFPLKKKKAFCYLNAPSPPPFFFYFWSVCFERLSFSFFYSVFLK